MIKDRIARYAQTIRKFYTEHKRMPSYSEMLGIFGLSSKNAAYKRVAALIKAGFLEKDTSGRILPLRLGGSVRLLGTVAAGFPSPAEEETRDLMSIDDYLISNPQATYLLKVDGDSMIDAGIHPGDLVLVQRALQPKHGDIVVAQIDGDWTLKRFESHRGITVLRAANRKYPPFTPKNELVIAGIVIANVRKYR